MKQEKFKQKKVEQMRSEAKAEEQRWKAKEKWDKVYQEIEREKEVEQISKESRQNNLNNAKLECEEIGFKKGTEAFGECVLDLTE